MFHNEKLASLGLVTSGIAHEINNPNSFIHFNIPILRKYLEELMPIVDEYASLHPEFEVFHMTYGELREDVFKLLENMEHGSQRINKIVGVLKGFVQKKDTGELQKTDLKKLIDKVVTLCHAEIRHKVKSFEVLVPEDLPPILTDPEALEQVLLNLLINSIHACDKEDSWIRLKVARGSSGRDDFVIEVTDNGSGIEENNTDKIFDPFFTTKTSTMGTGLGLYICHSHVQSLGGDIEVESIKGQGSTFRVLLPQTNKK
jgi:signal transduction histidine kinase